MEDITEEKKLMEIPPEKVLLMYQAVVDMVKEGSDINKMKVSDITTRAGIGKGTAYEYFSSKEEIITKALAYDMDKKLLEITAIVESGGNFARKVKGILDFIEEKFCENQTFCTLVRIGTGSYEISASFKKEFEWVQNNFSCGKIEQLIERIMLCGQEEGVIRQKNPYLNRMAFSAQMMAFATYLVFVSGGAKMPVSLEEAKQFAYESLVKSLN